MANRLHFLAICDNPVFLGLLQECVKLTNDALDTLKTGAQGFKAILAARPDLVFLDIGIADIDGLSWLEILREMKEGRDLSVIVGGEKMDPKEIARAFELGADDCILFGHCDPREVAARIHATLRRHLASEDRAGAALVLGPVKLDLSCHRCFVGGEEVRLRPREFELLEILIRKAGRVLSRPYLLESVWGMSGSASTRAVDATVYRLRKALGEKAAGWIEPVTKFGYRFSDPGKITR